MEQLATWEHINKGVLIARNVHTQDIFEAKMTELETTTETNLKQHGYMKKPLKQGKKWYRALQ